MQNTHYLYDVTAPSAELFGPGRYTDSVGEISDKKVDHNRENTRSIERDVVNVEASFDLNENWTLRYIGGWSDSDTSYFHDSDHTGRVASADNPFLSADAGVPFEDSQASFDFPKKMQSNELHLLGEVGKASLLFGVYQFNEESPYFLQTWEFANQVLVQFANFCFGEVTRDCARNFTWNIEAETDSIAAFANVDFKLNERWTLSGGIRHSEDEKTQDRNEYNIAAFFFGGVEEPAARTYDDWMGHATVEFHPQPEQMWHARYARAFRAGGFNSFTFGFAPRTYGGETMDSYEVGYKAALNDGRSMISVNFYHYDYDDFQQDLTYQKILDGNPVDVSEWVNIDGSTITGLEIEGEVLLSDQIRLRGFYAWTDSSLGDLLAFNEADPIQEWGNNGFSDFPVNPFQIGGNPFPSLAEHQFSASLVWDLNDTSIGDFSILTTYSWVGDREGSIWNIAIDEMPAYDRCDARVTWLPKDERFEVTSFIDNIQDKHGVTENQARWWDEDFFREGNLTDGRFWGMEVRFVFN